MTPGCTGKVRYKTFKDAENVAKWQSRRHSEAFSAYACRDCHGFHTGQPVLREGKRKHVTQPRKDEPNARLLEC
jgi:hypothetical protein